MEFIPTHTGNLFCVKGFFHLDVQTAKLLKLLNIQLIREIRRRRMMIGDVQNMGKLSCLNGYGNGDLWTKQHLAA